MIFLKLEFLFVELVKVPPCTNQIPNLILDVDGLHLMMKLKVSILRNEDLSGGRIRTEICCAKCNGHLGHVFHGEQITEKDTRHCVNSLSIKFIPYNNLQKVYFGAGCFWSVEKIFREVKGVYLVSSLVIWEVIQKILLIREVCNGDTNHAQK